MCRRSGTAVPHIHTAQWLGFCSHGTAAGDASLVHSSGFSEMYFSGFLGWQWVSRHLTVQERFSFYELVKLCLLTM